MSRIVGFFMLFFCVVSYGQVPSGYYDDAAGLEGEELRQALHDIIDNHTVKSYTSLWTAYRTTDKNSRGFVWDMYSDVPGGVPDYDYVFGYERDGGNQCGTYSGEGSCYNREHSFPKSWFDDASPMVTDIFHVVPSDGYVNSMRSNYPFGETNNPTWTSTNGSKLGSCSVEGYSGRIFEPIDEYKGDFARIYFYMATRYYGEDAGWPGSPMVNGSQLKPWALAMMLKWHEDDPVSDKEINRNDDIYTYVQHNRNPYVDHPEYVNAVYGGGSGSVDYIAPEIDSITVLGSTELKVWFNEAVDPQTSQEKGKYYINRDITVSSVIIQADKLSVVLQVKGLSNGSFNLTVSGIEDIAGNAMQVKVYAFQVTGLVDAAILSADQMMLYPNPGTGEFVLKSSVINWEKLEYNMFDLSGRKVDIQADYEGNVLQVHSNLDKGCYYLIIKISGGEQLSLPVLIQ